MLKMKANQRTFVCCLFQTTGGLGAVLCEGRGLDDYIRFGSLAEKEAFQNVSCLLSPRQLSDARRELLRNLDGGKLLSQASRPGRR